MAQIIFHNAIYPDAKFYQGTTRCLELNNQTLTPNRKKNIMPNLTEEEKREFIREIAEILDNHAAELTAAGFDPAVKQPATAGSESQPYLR